LTATEFSVGSESLRATRNEIDGDLGEFQCLIIKNMPWRTLAFG
jgi:hypothetical protein